MEEARELSADIRLFNERAFPQRDTLKGGRLSQPRASLGYDHRWEEGNLP